jgi:hypothetical protein
MMKDFPVRKYGINSGIRSRDPYAYNKSPGQSLYRPGCGGENAGWIMPLISRYSCRPDLSSLNNFHSVFLFLMVQVLVRLVEL